jgi:protease II
MVTMRRSVLAALALGLSADVFSQSARPTPPPTRRDDVREVLHGVELVDPYRWLEDDKSPETRAWIDAQNRFTHATLDGSASRESIRQRLTALSRYDVQSAPLRRGDWYFVREGAPPTTSTSTTCARARTARTRCSWTRTP